MEKDLRRGRPNGHKRAFVECSLCKRPRWIEIRDLKRKPKNLCVKCSHPKKHNCSPKTSEYRDLYDIWCGIKRRCYNKNVREFKNYGGKGIGISHEWRDFENFKNDMVKRQPGYSIDRIDNNKGYSKENCRWATAEEQMNNQNKTVKITHNGQEYTISDLHKKYGIEKYNIYNRLVVFKWSFEKCFSTPVKGRKK